MNGAGHPPLPAPTKPAAPKCRRSERLLQVNLALLTTLGTLLLGMGEQNVLLPVLAVIVAISSVYLTDIKGWLQLNTLVANIAGVIALLVTWREWNDYASESQLLSLANLLIYLQFVLLYRRKTIRTYWLLLLLSLLQVAVAAALNMSFSFGLLLPAYMFIGLVTMALFVIHRAQEDHAGDNRDPRLAAPAVTAPAATARRWPLAGVATELQAVEPPAATAGGLGWTFFRQMLWLAFATCVFATVWFLGMPRPGKKTPWQPVGISSYTSVGFSETVELGQLGEVYENPEEVMQVEFRRVDSTEPYRIGGDCALFRGGVLYEYHSGRWQPLPHFNLRSAPLLPLSKDKLPADEDVVIEKVRIRARNDNVLFSTVPAFALKSATRLNGIEYSNETDQFVRPNSSEGPYTYELATTAFKGHVPMMLSPAQVRPNPKALRAALLMPLSERGGDPFPGLRAEAARVAGRDANAKREQMARYLESYFRSSNLYKYSLRDQPHSLGLDPVEAFVTEHKTGHCEYFASALVLMLRSLNIPARLAIGFKGGDYNAAGRYYQIRELHAHAWVEAYLSPDALPPALADDATARQNGAWLILDPTPGRSEVEMADAFGLGPLKRLLDLTQLLWTNYVLGLDSKRQQEVIYRPLLARLEELFNSVAGEETREWLQRSVSDFFQRRMGFEYGLFSWQGFLASTTILLLLSGLWKLSAAAISLIRRRWLKRPHGKKRAAYHIEFYERFESLLARHGMPRAAGQTPREFALATGGYLAASPLTAQTAGLPKRIVEAFYFLRFGRHTLAAGELQVVEHAVSELAAALEARRASNSSRIDS